MSNLRIISITGPSASGKSSLASASELITACLNGIDGFEEKLKAIIPASVQADVREVYLKLQNEKKNFPIAKEAVSYTTRAARDGEVDGKHYNFVSVEGFRDLELYDETLYSGNFYGLAKSSFQIEGADIALAVIDQNGVRNIKAKCSETGDKCLSVFVKSSPEVMLERIVARGDDAATIERRLNNAIKNNEFECAIADIIVDNTGSFKVALEKLLNLL